MQRRDFCKLIAAAAAARAIPAKGQPALNAPAGFNKLQQTYEEFCATPENKRNFYALVDGKIVETKLDNANWAPTAWGEPPELPGEDFVAVVDERVKCAGYKPHASGKNARQNRGPGQVGDFGIV